MFENDADTDFGDDFSINFAKTVTNKRPLEAPQSVAPKKPKSGPSVRNVVKRKFPGPAGLLPVLENPDSVKNEEIPCSQMSVSAFQSSPWLEVTSAYDTIIDNYNIRWIKTSAERNQLVNQKAPFLAAIIKSIECLEGKNSIVKIVLKDITGEIQGSIIHSLYKEYSKSLVAGSVIVLRQCGVLTTSYSNNHYLAIAASNLVTIYWKNDDRVEVIRVQDDELVKGTKMGNQNENLPVGQVEEIGVWEDDLEGVDMDSLFDGL